MDSISVQCRGGRCYEFTPANSALLVIHLQREIFAADGGDMEYHPMTSSWRYNLRIIAQGGRPK
jgi:hypothetical protein